MDTQGGEATIEQRSPPQQVILYCSWFCPYAQRAWIALEEKGIEYQYVEITPYKSDPNVPGGLTKNPMSIEEKRERYPDFVLTSPRGLVPGIACTREGEVDRIYESVVCAEYVSEAFPGTPLMPTKPADRAKARIWIAYMNEKVIPHFYKMLMLKGPDEREEHRRLFVDGWAPFAEAMQPVVAEGAFFFGDQFSLVDICVAPWWERALSVGATYRGVAFPEGAPYDRLRLWYKALLARPSFARTIVDQQRLVNNYSGYADGTATSTVAKEFVTDK